MGYLVDSLASNGHDAHGLDVSSVAVEHCQQNCKGSYKQGSILSIPYPDESFDTVISTDCLEHIAEHDIPKAISEISRVTKRQAYMRIATRIDRDKKWHLVVKKEDGGRINSCLLDSESTLLLKDYDTRRTQQ